MQFEVLCNNKDYQGKGIDFHHQDRYRTEALELRIVNDFIHQNGEGNTALIYAFLVAKSIAKNEPISVKLAKVDIDKSIGVSSLKEALLVRKAATPRSFGRRIDWKVWWPLKEIEK